MRYVFCFLFFLCCLPVLGQSRGAFVEEISNEHSSFAVRVDVDRSDRVYAKDDLLQVSVQSSENGYLYLLYRDAVGNVSVLFPNRFQQNNFIRAGETVPVPAPGSNFNIRIDEPFGSEMLKAVVSKKPLTYIDTTAFIGANMTPVAEGTAKNFSKSVEKETPDWAEHQIFIQTVPSRSGSSQPSPSPDGGKRFAVAIGISDYKDDNITNLGVCHFDAERILKMLTERCGVAKDNTILLPNEKATLDNVRKTIKEELPQRTKPGDTVFFFWSGHGGQTSDGKKEFLVPYDGSNGDAEETMLMDEMFGRWVQELDGRKVLIMIDACHSGGMAANAKKDQENDGDWRPLRFAFTRLALVKDIGQKDAAVIASSTAAESSFVRREKDLSVFTYYVLQAVEGASHSITHTQLTTTVKPQVTRYIEQNFTNKQQTVVMQDDMTEPLVMNP